MSADEKGYLTGLVYYDKRRTWYGKLVLVVQVQVRVSMSGFTGFIVRDATSEDMDQLCMPRRYERRLRTGQEASE